MADRVIPMVSVRQRVVLQLKSAYRDATTHIVMSAQEFMQRLAARVPRSRLHLIRFCAVLAPHAKLRAAVVPEAVYEAVEPANEHAHGKAARMIEQCACGGQLKVLAAIEAPVYIARILTHLGLRASATAFTSAGAYAIHRDRSRNATRVLRQGLCAGFVRVRDKRSNCLVVARLAALSRSNSRRQT